MSDGDDAENTDTADTTGDAETDVETTDDAGDAGVDTETTADESEPDADGADTDSDTQADTESDETDEADADADETGADADEADESEADAGADEAGADESESEADADEAGADADEAEADEPEADDSEADDSEADADTDAGGEVEPAEEAEAPTAESLQERLAEVEEELEAAETEAELDAVEERLDAIEADLEAADLPEPDEDDEDDEEAEDPRAEIESEIERLRETLEEKRGPYGEDVVAAIEESKSTIEDTRWTNQGETEVADAVVAFTEDAGETLDGEFTPEGRDQESLLSALDDVAEAVEAASFDADEDADEIAALLEATDDLAAGLDDAQEWDDLMVHEQLEAQGFYDPLGHYKDFPPEWAALKEWEKRGNVEMVLLALETFDSGFMEEHCLNALTRMGDPAAFEAMHQRAQKRDKPSITALGKMGSGAEDALETLLEYVDADSDPALQKVTFKALGEIGSEEATQALADKLVMDNDSVRPYAARALGLIGDTRAVKPLTDTLADDDRDTVRAAAAWALRQIGTESALETVAEYTDDSTFLVQHEADLAADALDASDADAATTPT